MLQKLNDAFKMESLGGEEEMANFYLVPGIKSRKRQKNSGRTFVFIHTLKKKLKTTLQSGHVGGKVNLMKPLVSICSMMILRGQ